MTDTSYLATTGIAFVRQLIPGFLPIITDPSTAAQTSELVRQHTNLLRLFQETVNTDRALKQQILEVFDDDYTQAINDPNIGFANVTAIQIITHLYDFFGKISPNDLEANAEKLMTPYDPSLPITTLFNQVENCVAYSEASNKPFNPT